MQCPACKLELTAALNRQGKIVDFCESCQGMWLDKGEIFCYSKKPSQLAQQLVQGLIDGHQGERICPRCDKPMEVGGLIKPDLEVDCCRACGGIWLDSGELNVLKNLQEIGPGGQSINDSLRSFPRAAKLSGNALTELEAQKKTTASAAELAAFPLPSLAFRTVMTLGVLYGMLFVFMVAITEANNLSPLVSIGITALIIFIQFLISPFLLDMQLSWLYHCEFVTADRLPPHLTKFVAKLCAEKNMNFPSFGLIADSTPNAFTYGHHPGNARIVLTRGIIQALSPDELESVVAHEIGHAVHWDMVLMTIAALVPIVLYQIYRALMKVVQRGSGKKDGKAPLLAIAVGAYICYVISEYIVLFLSRTREYHADRFAAEACGNSTALASALIKVAYGLASDAVAAESAIEGEEKVAVAGSSSARGLAPLGIFDPTSAKALAASTAVLGGGSGAPDKDRIKDAMQWDLWNPWAWWYELHSTHPLVANRLDQLGRMSFRFGHKPFIIFDRQQPESYWDEFAVDFIMLWTPWVLGFIGAGAGYFLHHLPTGAIGGFLVGLAMGNIMQNRFTYTFDFLPHTVASLLKQVKVSGIRAVPARLNGKVIGKGIPGYIFSEDMTFQDSTGYMFMDYQQPLAPMEWWFALAKDAYVGQEVIIEGWYKRAPVPYLEVYTVKPVHGPAGVLNTSWSNAGRWIFNILLGLIGLAIMVTVF